MYVCSRFWLKLRLKPRFPSLASRYVLSSGSPLLNQPFLSVQVHPSWSILPGPSFLVHSFCPSFLVLPYRYTFPRPSFLVNPSWFILPGPSFLVHLSGPSFPSAPNLHLYAFLPSSSLLFLFLSPSSIHLLFFLSLPLFLLVLLLFFLLPSSSYS